MPLPLILAGASAGASFLSGGMKTYANYQASKERERSLKQNAAIARQRGKTQERDLRERANIMSEQGRKESSMFYNELANRGIALEGSPMILLTEQFAEQLEDRNETYRQGAIARIAGENQARILEYQAANEKSMRPFQLFGDIMGTASSTMSSFVGVGGIGAMGGGGGTPAPTVPRMDSFISGGRTKGPVY